MLISVCIPHYNRSRFLLKVLDSIVCQNYAALEVVISDDCSTDDSSTVIPAYIQRNKSKTRVRLSYIRQNKNLGYDGNTHAALAAGNGDYLFLLGNDDALVDERTIERLAATSQKLQRPDVAFCNYCSYARRDDIVRRALVTAKLGTGPDIAAKVFRSFSFMSGIIYARDAFRRHNTDAYDGSIYVQVYLASRIIAAGGLVAAIDDPMVAKDVVIENRKAVDFPALVAERSKRIAPATGGLDQVGRVACEAVLPFVTAQDRNRMVIDIYRQIYVYTYLYWLYCYRRDGVFRASLNLVLGSWPMRFVKVRNLNAWVYLRLFGYYLTTTFAGLLIPVRVLDAFIDAFKNKVYRLAKTV